MRIQLQIILIRSKFHSTEQRRRPMREAGVASRTIDRSADVNCYVKDRLLGRILLPPPAVLSPRVSLGRRAKDSRPKFWVDQATGDRHAQNTLCGVRFVLCQARHAAGKSHAGPRAGRRSFSFCAPPFVLPFVLPFGASFCSSFLLDWSSPIIGSDGRDRGPHCRIPSAPGVLTT